MSALGPLAKLPRWIERHGWRGTAAIAWTRFRHSRVPRVRLYTSEALFDLRHGVHTRGIVRHEKVGAFADAFRYEATPRSRIRRSLAALPVDPARFTFIDLGCGRGLVLLLAAERGFRRVVGIELSDELAASARANARRFVARNGLTTPVEVIEGDATTPELPDGPLVIYVYNSFARAGFEALADHLARDLAARPRELHLVYMFPESREALDRVPGLRPLEENRRFVIYSAAPAAAPDGGRTGDG